MRSAALRMRSLVFLKSMAAKKRYNAGDLENAIAEMQGEAATSMRAVALKFGIPPTTLHDHLKQKSKKIGVGGPTVLATAVEREIALTCVTLADMGFGLTRDLINGVIHDYIRDKQIPNPFTAGVPGKDWWQRFMKRWPFLSERKSEHFSKKRAQAGGVEIIREWFKKVEEVLSTAGLDPHDPDTATRLWNCDETAFCTSVASKRLIVQRGTKVVHEVGGGSGRTYITVQCAGSGAGIRLPPFILYKGKNMYKRWMEGGPAAALYGISDSGWMDAANSFRGLSNSFFQLFYL